MKNIFKIGTLALCLAVGLSSCNDFFDAIPGEQYDLEDTFTNRSKTEQFLNNVYNYVPDETLERFKQRHIKVLRTDKDGAIRFKGWFKWSSETVR